MSDGESYTSAAKSNGVDYHDNSKLLPEVWSWPDNFLRDNSTIVSQYSYSSTWSSNYTMSNLPGPGRLLGKLFSSAGAILERFIGKLAQSKELWDFSLADTNLRKAVTFNVMKSGDTMQKEKAWGILLDYARSSNSDFQLMAFEEIAYYAVRFPQLRHIAEMVCRKHNEPIEALTFSWKRPGIDYSSAWLYFYNLASCCLAPHANPVMDAVARLGSASLPYGTLDFSHFEEVFSQCRDTFDTILVIEVMCWVWNGQGIGAYAKKNGFNDSKFRNLALASLARFDVLSSHHARSVRFSYIYHYAMFVDKFLLGMWASIRALASEESDRLSEDDSEMEIWAEIFKLHCVTRLAKVNFEQRSRLGRKIHSFLKDSSEKYLHTWKDACREELPGPEHSKFCERLVQLEDIHGEAIRKCFPVAED